MTDKPTPGSAAVRPQPFRHMVRGVVAWRCVDCGEMFADWPSDDAPCPAHEKGSDDA